MEGPRGAEAVRGGADSRRHLRRAGRLRHRRHAGAVLPRMEGAVSPGREAARQEARAHADPAGHPSIRAARAAEPARHRAELCRVRGRRRPDRPQADPLQAVYRRERGDAAHPHCPEAERAGRNRLAHTGVGEEPDHAVARAQAPPRRVAAATHRRHRHRPHQARPADRRGIHRVRVPEPRARGQRARSAAHPRAPRPARR